MKGTPHSVKQEIKTWSYLGSWFPSLLPPYLPPSLAPFLPSLSSLPVSSFLLSYLFFFLGFLCHFFFLREETPVPNCSVFLAPDPALRVYTV